MNDSIEARAQATADEIIGVFVDDRLKAMPLPDGFWRDPYVLGFLMITALQLTQGRHGDELEAIPAAEAVFQALGETSGIGADDMKDIVGKLQNEGNLDYFKAQVAADKLTRFILGSTSSKLDPIVLRARQQAIRMRESGALDPNEVSEEAALRGVLVTTLFTDVVLDRFGLSADV